ncbi:MAG: hypothetical protein HPY79_11425 [Bacteroidales bacterium]|nr:hypothetical protein [Bacteroidales bacterium]
MKYLFVISFLVFFSTIHGQQTKANNKVTPYIKQYIKYYKKSQVDSAQFLIKSIINYHIKKIYQDDKHKKQKIEQFIRDLYNIAKYFHRESQYDEAIIFLKNALNFCAIINNYELSTDCYSLLIDTYKSKNKIDEAINIALHLIKINEEHKDTSLLCVSYINIGNIYNSIQYSSISQKYYNLAYNLASLKGYNKIKAQALYNLSLIERKKLHYPEAIEKTAQALNIFKQMKDTNGIILCYIGLGNINADLGNYPLSIIDYKNALELYNHKNDKKGISSCLINIGQAYLEYSDSTKDITLKSRFLKDALNNSIKGYETADEIKDTNLLYYSSYSLIDIYNRIGDKSKALTYAYNHILFSETLFNNDKLKTFAELESKYENEEKQLKINQLYKDKKINELEINRRKEKEKLQFYIIILTSIMLVILLISTYLILKRFKITKRQLEIIKTQKEKLNDQKNEIEALYDKLTDSIEYAYKIQQTILSVYNPLKILHFQSFILYRPKDVVSGDFYWAKEVNQFSLIAVADCTGHGIPGAFMSILGISLLNSIIHKREITCTSDALKEMQKELKYNLHQSNNILLNYIDDNIEIALIAINNEEKTIDYCGIGIPLYFYNHIEQQIIIYKPNDITYNIAEQSYD